MQIKIDNLKENPTNLLRKLGYIFQHHSGNEMSFVRPLAQSGYPRFHIYAHTENFTLFLNIHLDQKKETYGKNTRHHGEYADSDALRQEVLRIKSLLKIQ